VGSRGCDTVSDFEICTFTYNVRIIKSKTVSIEHISVQIGKQSMID
jgi:hypothetical protein